MLRFAFVIMILLGVGVGAVGTLVWVSTRGPADAAAAPQTHVTVLAAAHALDAGSLLKPEDVEEVQMTPGELPAGAFSGQPPDHSNLVGAMIRRPLARDAAILSADILRPGEHGFLAAVLAPGMIATTVSVDAVSGTAGLIWPGDRVDLILTQIHDEAGQASGRRVSAETVLHDVRAIAVDQKLVHAEIGGTASPPPQNGTVTLEVTSLQAERVSVAARLGHLAVAVRSAELAAAAAPATQAGALEPAGSGHAAPPPVVWGDDVSAALTTDLKAAPPSAPLRVFEGSSDGKEYHF